MQQSRSPSRARLIGNSSGQIVGHKNALLTSFCPNKDVFIEINRLKPSEWLLVVGNKRFNPFTPTVFIWVQL